MVLFAILVQNVLALSIIWMVASARAVDRRNFALLVAGAGLFLIALMLAGMWVYPPIYGAGLYLVLFLLAIWRARRPVPSARQSPSRLAMVAGMAMSVMGLLLIGYGATGRMQPDGPFARLASPLARSAGSCVLSGGNSLLLNAHFYEGPNTGSSFEKHSVDFTKRNQFGFRTLAHLSYHPKPTDPAHYAIFGELVRAPCGGKVLSVENNKPDNLAGFEYRSDEGANLVELSCKDAHVVLAHFRQGSIQVVAGQQIEVGDLLGQVGNSGNTEEPHLHIHAQSLPGHAANSRVPRPIPMLFDDRYLSRGDCL